MGLAMERMERAMNEIILAGCTPTPLANYLKALGVFRLVAEQKDP
jgi:CRISPR-associated protein Csx17